jgi:hypothetical protein
MRAAGGAWSVGRYMVGLKVSVWILVLGLKEYLATLRDYILNPRFDRRFRSRSFSDPPGPQRFPIPIQWRARGSSSNLNLQVDRVCLGQTPPYPASKSTSEVMLIALYDLGIHVAVLAHGALPALLAVADGSSLA